MTVEEIKRSLKNVRFGTKIYHFNSIDSTNTFAKSLLAGDTAEGTIVIAESQTDGKGRQGRSWHSEPGLNLTFSIILYPAILPKYIGLVSLYAGLAVSGAIARIAQLQPECKWPNDILLGGKKVCGILSESSFNARGRMAVIIGIGVNVNQTAFPPDLRRPATSLKLSGGRDIDRVDTLCEILYELETLYPLLEDEHRQLLVERWSKQSLMFGKEIAIDHSGRVTKGIARALAEDGQLIVDTPEGHMNIVAGDITLV